MQTHLTDMSIDHRNQMLLHHRPTVTGNCQQSGGLCLAQPQPGSHAEKLNGSHKVVGYMHCIITFINSAIIIMPNPVCDHDYHLPQSPQLISLFPSPPPPCLSHIPLISRSIGVPTFPLPCHPTFPLRCHPTSPPLMSSYIPGAPISSYIQPPMSSYIPPPMSSYTGHSPSHVILHPPSHVILHSPSHVILHSPSPVILHSPSHVILHSPSHVILHSPSHVILHSPSHVILHSPSHVILHSPSHVILHSPSHVILHSPSHVILHSPSHVILHSPSHVILPPVKCSSWLYELFMNIHERSWTVHEKFIKYSHCWFMN